MTSTLESVGQYALTEPLAALSVAFLALLLICALSVRQ